MYGVLGFVNKFDFLKFDFPGQQNSLRSTPVEVTQATIIAYIHNSQPTETTPGGPVVECSPGVQEVVGSFPGRVIPKTFKMVLDASLLSVQHLKVR